MGGWDDTGTSPVVVKDGPVSDVIGNQRSGGETEGIR